MKKLRLAMVTPFPQKEGIITGGVEGVAHSLTDGLLKTGGLEIHIVAPRLNGNCGIEKRDQLTVHWIQYPKMPGFMAYWSVLRKAIHRCIKGIDPDVTHFQGIAGWTLGFNHPYVLTIHGIYERDVLFTHRRFKRLRHYVISLIECMGRRRSRNITLISPYILETVGHQINGNSWHIENPVTEDFYCLRRKAGSLNILYAGRINRRKNVLGLIRSFAKTKKMIPEATLRIAGGADSPSYELECRRYVKELSLENAVFFLGYISRDSLKMELASAACLALVSFQETAPMVVEEAMAAGVPVVGSKVCGLPFMIEDGESGFLVDPHNEKEISSCLIRLLQDQEMNERFSKRCRLIAKERFHVSKVSRSTLDLYRAVYAGISP